jgi:hypothetical protein
LALLLIAQHQAAPAPLLLLLLLLLLLVAAWQLPGALLTGAHCCCRWVWPG